MTQGKYAAFKRELAAHQTTPGGFAGFLVSNLKLSFNCFGPRQGGGIPPPPLKQDCLSLYFNLAARIFKLLLGGIGLRLGSALQHRLGRAFHQGLGFGQP